MSNPNAPKNVPFTPRTLRQNDFRRILATPKATPSRSKIKTISGTFFKSGQIRHAKQKVAPSGAVYRDRARDRRENIEDDILPEVPHLEETLEEVEEDKSIKTELGQRIIESLHFKPISNFRKGIVFNFSLSENSSNVPDEILKQETHSNEVFLPQDSGFRAILDYYEEKPKTKDSNPRTEDIQVITIEEEDIFADVPEFKPGSVTLDVPEEVLPDKLCDEKEDPIPSIEDNFSFKKPKLEINLQDEFDDNTEYSKVIIDEEREISESEIQAYKQSYVAESDSKKRETLREQVIRRNQKEKTLEIQVSKIYESKYKKKL